ncbi:non-ribosomal peptide synthetase [Amycolatopsis azurea]|uniref:Long-chain-fatty-acid--CoA ligase n=1 Tax=Amycolatopsis azurea DSM 43854 TaxID=1238180 RepID=M2PY78_9PSEU|nr:non-ribosomal peptide synthetase [Amycolatopsis azurea]EMD29578.1 Long-chain-fatty-acid--CoA ligase [Amycolatopsis azurea DSM 43854]OOC02651.1 non-ribosomal peptide synthetase [Amycolatopsis azurea DSM 43854]
MDTRGNARAELLRRRLRGSGTPEAGGGIVPVPRDRPLPLSFAQRGLWLLDQTRPGGADYLMPVRLRLRGEVNEPALRRALDEVVARHEVLRTRYLADGSGGEPVQVVDEPGPVPFERLDLAERPESLEGVLADAGARSLDLAGEWALRALLVRLSDVDHVLLLSVHHIASDGISESILLSELDRLYAAFSAGRPSPLEPLAVQYGDFSVWQRDRLSDGRLTEKIEYWRKQLDGISPLELPTDRARGPVRDSAGATVPVFVPGPLAETLARLGREHGATPYMVLLAAFQVLLGRYSGQSDVVVGSPVAGREQDRTGGLVGMFVNMIAQRADLSADLSFTEFLSRVRATALDAYTHQDTPFDLVVDELVGERDPSRTPLFQVVFQLGDEGTPQHLPGLGAEPESPGWEVAKYDLDLTLATRPDGSITGRLGYATALFDAETAHRMSRHFARLLESIAAEPTRRVHRLAMLADEEREVLLAAGNGPDHLTFPTDESLTEVFAARLADNPAAIAVSCAGEQLTYAELDARANRLAHRLRSLGSAPGRLIGVSLDRGLDLVVALLGVLKSGAGYVPLDPALPAGRLKMMRADAEVGIVVSRGELAGWLADEPVTSVLLDQPGHDWPDTDLEPLAGPGDVAYVIYTSGSTGRPKGVPVTHANVLRLLRSCAADFAFGPSDVWTLFHSYAFDFSVWELWGALLHGGRVVVVPFEISRSPWDFLDLLIAEGVTVLNQTPSAFRRLVDAVVEAETSPESLALRAVVFGGEALDVADVAPWFARFGDERPALVNMYGITETTVHVTYRRLRAGDIAAGSRSPLGRPLPDLRVYLLDGDLEPVPVGVPGELYVSGPGLALGYLGHPSLTADRFGPDPYASRPGARMYRTGDLARRTLGGDLEFAGRADDQVKIRGHRIEPGEVESALAGHASVSRAVVLARRRPGEAEHHLVAYAVPVAGHRLAAADLREHLSGLLPAYMVPAAFVPLDRFPLTSNGKIDRAALPEPAVDHTRATGPVAPRDPAERAMAEVWGTALGVGSVGVHDNFFALGGDSIRAIQVVGLLRKRGLPVTVQDLLLHQTVESLTRFTGTAAGPVEDRRVAPFELIGEADRKALPEDLADAYPMSLGQTAMVYEMVADAKVSLYHNITLFPIVDDAPFSLSALREAAVLLVRRHEILRTSFDLTGYRVPMQLVHRTAPMDVGHDDLREIPEARVEEILAAFVADTRRSPLDVTSAPLVRFHVHQTAERRWTLSFIECHAVLDGWSHHSLLEELLDTYRSLRDGLTPTFPEQAPVRFADFIAHEKRSLESTVDREFWRDRLDRYDPVTLPPGWAAAPSADGLPHQVSVRYADLEPRLRALAAVAGASLKTVLFAAHLKVLSTISGSSRFHTGLVHNGRLEEPGGELARGMHLNPLPVCVDLTAKTWTGLVREVFAEEVAVWPHRRFPLGELQRLWGSGRPLVDISFAYLDFHVFDTQRVETAKIVDESYNGFGVDVWSFPGVLHFRAQADRIAPEHVEALAPMYRRVLEAMAADPDGEVRGAAIAPAEVDRLMSFADGPVAEYPDACVHELFERQVARTPDVTALRCADGTTVTYAELDARANKLARHLRERGAGPETVVGVLLRRGPELVAALLAVLKSGAAYLPLDPAHPAKRLATVLTEAGVTTVVTESALADRVPGTAVVLVGDPAIAAHPDGDLGRTATPSTLAYVIYTSGSTGTPKGVMVEHRNLVNYLSWRAGSTASPLYSSMAFDLPVTSVFPALLSGGTVTLTPDDDTPAIEALVSALSEGGFDLVKLTPSHLMALNQMLPAEAFAGAASRLVVGGEELTRDMLTAWTRNAPDILVDNEYGPTEATVGCSSQVSRVGDLEAGPVPIGKPGPNTVLRVLDADLEPVPVGVLGELYIGGAQLARGYRGRPGLTADRFVPDPYSDGRRLYRTGDLARYRPDGVLEFAGRADDQVKIRGYRVELGEVEAVLRAHAELRDVAVRARRTARGDQELVAYLVPADEGLDPATLPGLLAGAVPDYLIPSAWMVLAELPTTPSGKLDTKALPEPTATARAAMAPRTAVENIIATALAKGLGIDRVGVDVPFSDLGLHSLLIIRVLVELREEHGLPVELRDFYEHRTVIDLAAAVDPASKAGFPPTEAAAMESASGWARQAVVWLRRTGTKPPLFCMYPGGGLWYVRLAEHISADRPVAALEWPGLHRDTPSPQSIASVAALFVEQIRAVHPEGPYHLLGWCGGGLVTGEMARILHRDGERLTLMLLDPAQDFYKRENMWEETAMFVRGEKLLEELNATADPDELAEIHRQFAEVLDYIIDEGTKEPPVPGDPFWPRRIRVWRELTQAMLGYRQRPYPGRTHLLVGDELADGLHETNFGQSYAQYRDRWVKLAPGGLKIHRVGGDHMGVLRPPHVSGLAGLLTTLMEATEEASP